MKTKEVKKIKDLSKVKFLLFTFTFLLFLASCNEIQSPKSEPFYGEMKVPVKQEVRWSNGTLPKTLDPAFALGSPETDIIRAVFEGLTESDAKTLKAIPAIATKWTASNDNKIWTFHLRKEAKWSNDKNVTASDFVNSWKRLAELGNTVSYPNLLKNISGMNVSQIVDERDIFVSDDSAETATALPSNDEIKKPLIPANLEKKEKFGVEAVSEHVLKITLNEPDKDFPSLVAHPMFSPILNAKEFEIGKINAAITTNGAFRISSIGRDGITLDRADYYWNKDKISLDRVKFVPIETPEAALKAYRGGEVDVLTNFNFEPLALKLLKPFEDFRMNNFGAVNLYQFNSNRPQFNDIRVREALAISLDRKRLTEDEMDGATQPANSYSPFSDGKNFAQNIVKAKQLLAEAGFKNGENFPEVRLLVNRNDIQKRVANAVAKMWLQNLGIKTEVVIKSREEFEILQKSGDFDVIRRGVILPTVNETSNISAMFSRKIDVQTSEKIEKSTNSNVANTNANANVEIITNSNSNSNVVKEQMPSLIIENEISTEAEALAEIPAIPLYFSTSYSLIKPYIEGFEPNELDAPSLKTVKINNNWKSLKTN
jgi:oligopeptide transport system substrate-binding protein